MWEFSSEDPFLWLRFNCMLKWGYHQIHHLASSKEKQTYCELAIKVDLIMKLTLFWACRLSSALLVDIAFDNYMFYMFYLSLDLSFSASMFILFVLLFSGCCAVCSFCLNENFPSALRAKNLIFIAQLSLSKRITVKTSNFIHWSSFFF